MTAPTNAQHDEGWDDHWKSYAAINALNPAQVYRRKLVFGCLALRDAATPVRLIDFGSGSGELASEILRARPDAEVVGLDLSPTGVETSRKKVPGARFFQQDFTQPMKLGDEYRGWATHAVCSEVLEHLDAPTAMLANVRPYLAPGCKLVITVPAGPRSAFDKHIGHRAHFTTTRLANTLRAAGLDVVDLRGAGFPFFNLYRLAVVLRGEKLIEDGADTGQAQLPLAARATIRMFSWLFKLNTDGSKLGWQLVAVGTVPRR
jgi:2-polyprenyl-3-methyl-5-hydroxy-6-metoxy-1,4-benzoquinol methylase